MPGWKSKRVILRVCKGIVDVVEVPEGVKVHLLDVDLAPAEERACVCKMRRDTEPHYHVKFEEKRDGHFVEYVAKNFRK